jgi:hypothetical protein
MACLRIGIKNDRNKHDTAAAYLPDLEVPNDFGYAKQVEEMLYFAGGAKNIFKAVRLEVFSIL